MGLDLQQLRDDLRDATGTDIDDLSDEKVDRLLNRSYWEVLDKFPFREKEVTVTFNTIIGTRLYNMPEPFEALRKLSILEPATLVHKTIDRTTIDVYERTYDTNEAAEGFPTHYVREGCAARLLPTPDAIYEITEKYWTVLADLSITNDTPAIPQSWHEIILLGAIWRAFISFGDYQRARAANQHQIALINSAVPVEAKEEVDSPRGGLEVIVREYDV